MTSGSLYHTPQLLKPVHKKQSSLKMWFPGFLFVFITVTNAALIGSSALEWVFEEEVDTQDESSYSSVDACPPSAKALSCSLMASYKKGTLGLATSHASGKWDNAFAYNNIRDMCNGLPASRSSYSCKECPKGAPGGTVCLSTKLLTYLTTLVNKGSVYVTELAGACHNCTSKHYLGLAVDLRLSSRSSEYMLTCRSMGGVAVNELKDNHIHCQFNPY